MSTMSWFSEQNSSSFLDKDLSGKERFNNNAAEKSCDFIPIDWETGIEEAINEPLPDVMLINENDIIPSQNDMVPLKEVLENDSLITATTDKIENMNYITGFSKIKNPNVAIMSTISGLNDLKLTERFEQNCDELKKKFLGEISNADLDADSLPLRTPVKSAVLDKENFLNPQQRLKLIPIRNQHINSTRLRTPRMISLSDQYATPIAVKKTPHLLKPKESLSTSKFAIGTPIQKFSKIKVNLIEYIVMKVLGRGGSSVVYQCFNYDTTENRAIKCVSLDSPLSCEGNMKEIEVLKKLQACDRIIKMYDYELYTQEKKLYVVLEMGSADLAQILRDLSKHEKEAPSYLILFYWMEMLYAVQQIHRHGIIHSDLKPANFLQINGRLKIIDFGISSCLQNDSTSVIKTVSEGSSNYISPEALNCEYSTSGNSPNYGKPKYKIGYKADVWSLGCILYQLIYKRTPFEYISNQMQKLMTIANSSVKVEYPHRDKIPIKFIETVKKCLVHDAKLRSSLGELISEYEQCSEN